MLRSVLLQPFEVLAVEMRDEAIGLHGEDYGPSAAAELGLELQII